MPEPPRFLGVHDRFTIVKLRSHLLRYHFRGTSRAPDVRFEHTARGELNDLGAWEDDGGALRQGERRLRTILPQPPSSRRADL